MLKNSTLKFLAALDRNNNKPWFEANRGKYEEAKADFLVLVQALISKHGKKDASIASLEAKNCVFRINRDVRFSKDKRPYKNNFGAGFTSGGKKSPLAGYYFHCQPGNSFAGGGLWAPLPPDLKKVRQEIDYCFAEFKKITGSKKFTANFGGLDTTADISLVNVPRDFDKDNPAATFIKLKSFVATRKITDRELTSEALLPAALAVFEALQPLLGFINRSLAE
jgi:uncharacterized protein (TIGR02453 family)